MAYRDYSVVFENVSVSAAQDFFEISPADDKPVRLLGLMIDNVGGTADAGDAQEEYWRLAVIRGHTVSGSGGSAPTPAPLDSSAGTASGFASEVNNTTIANTGTTATLMAFGMGVRQGLREFWPEECQPGAGQGNTTIVVRLLSTPADAVSLSGTLFVREFG